MHTANLTIVQNDAQALYEFTNKASNVRLATDLRALKFSSHGIYTS